MNKKSQRGYMILGIVLVVFCCISFLPPFTMNAVFWSAFVFGLISILLQIYVFRISFTAGSDAKSKFYGFPIAKIGIIYLITQLVLSIIEMCTAAFLPIFVALIINVLLLAAALIGCITADIVRDEVVKQDVKTKIDVTNMRSLQSLSASLPGLCDDAAMKSKLQGLADAFRYSDPVSSESTRQLEYELGIKLQELNGAVSEKDNASIESLCKRVTGMLEERNRICKMSK